jgi:hypothetical protein
MKCWGITFCALHRLPGAVADSIWAMIQMCDVRGDGGAYKRQDPWQLLDRLQAPGSPLADQPDSKVRLACSKTQHKPCFSTLGIAGVQSLKQQMCSMSLTTFRCLAACTSPPG